jgi:hypothetical protein
MALTGIYCGLVEDNSDPEQLGRLKVRPPLVYGAVGSVFGAVPTASLPWAIPMGLPAGGSNASGGISLLPEIGDQVAVQFLDGEPEKPTWQWLMQTQKQAKVLALHEYGANGKPDRALFTRYGHSLEIKAQQVVLTTGEGEQVLLKTSQANTGGTAAFQTPAGQAVTLNDAQQSAVIQGTDTVVVSGQTISLMGTQACIVNAARFSVLCGDTTIILQDNTITIGTLSGASILVDSEGNIAINSAKGASVAVENDQVQIGEPTGTGLVIQSGQISINAATLTLNTASFSVGTAPGYPLLLLTPQMLSFLLSHTHTNGNDGSPTGPPIATDPNFPDDSATTRMQAS